MTQPLGNLAERARDLGLRMTVPRKAILAVLDESLDHPDVEEIHRRAAARAPGVNLATTYRTLALLSEQGLVEKHMFEDGRARFESAPSEHHDHFIDIESGEIVEFHSAELEALQAALARAHGFEIVAHRLEIKVRKLTR